MADLPRLNKGRLRINRSEPQRPEIPDYSGLLNVGGTIYHVEGLFCYGREDEASTIDLRLELASDRQKRKASRNVVYFKPKRTEKP